MSPADLAQRIAALDWSGTSLQHQLAVSAAILTLSHPSGNFVTALEVTFGAPPEPCNILVLPVRQRTCWTTICHMDGRTWSTSSHFGPGGAWNWIVESVAHEHNVSESAVGCIESDAEGPYDGDDLVTIDGMPVYRIQHVSR